MDSLSLCVFLSLVGLERYEVEELVNRKRISITNHQNGNVFVASTKEALLWEGDLVEISHKGSQIELTVSQKHLQPIVTSGKNIDAQPIIDSIAQIKARLKAQLANEESRRQKAAINARLKVQLGNEESSRQKESPNAVNTLDAWLGLAGGTGFIFGGPLSALLAYFAAQFLIREETKLHGRGHAKTLPFRIEAFCKWIAIGSLAMPASWLITRSLGWNLDPVAIVQSQGRFTSYKDWSEAEARDQQIERERRKLEYETRRAVSRAKFEKEQREEEAREAEATARQQREEEDRKLRLAATMTEFNDPEKSAARQKRQMEHLESVGCLDIYGRIIENMFCMNTEVPPES